VYPNPTSGLIYIQANAKQIGESYVVYSSNGAKVLSGKLTSKVTEVALRNLSEGAYLIRIGDDLRQTFRVIKKSLTK
jgi:hypothetical protein